MSKFFDTENTERAARGTEDTEAIKTSLTHTQPNHFFPNHFSPKKAQNAQKRKNHSLPKFLRLLRLFGAKKQTSPERNITQQHEPMNTNESTTTLDDLRTKAELGYADAQYNLSVAYAKGEGVPADRAEAAKWLRAAANQNHAQARDRLAWDKMAFENRRREATDLGLAQSQFNLGLAYYEGNVVPADRAEAAKWFRAAAKQGHAQAQDYLDRDKADFENWHREATGQGTAQAQFSLGYAYYGSIGVPVDKAEAVKWLRAAAGQGHAQAQYYLGVALSNGEGAPKNKAEAAKWFRAAAKQGHADAQFNLGIVCKNGEGAPVNKAEAATWFRAAAGQGHARAQYNLGCAYANGEGVRKDKDEAVRWYREAAGQDHAEAQYELGMLYRDGAKHAQDETRDSMDWIYLAAKQGHAEACHIMRGHCGPTSDW